ncbi:hypothetical protein H6F42_06515 [Pseudanabaena sp. FACHB-1998]|uniref:PIN domain-containing protein n=1 Tax=Pseudanabaena sp. FACHB-1998 TaxID=2692858 RepID=UPI00168160C7|nr:PIN domain-containing protein [Pseudanabaena sp. FACHB-1998]MBD2176566.1 hypothetical protein [Pseudanabaena sp. FACHB-1998]
MTVNPHLLILETSAILQTDIHTWKEIAKLGNCWLPEIVAKEIKNIAEGKAEGNESVARQFQNIQSQLNWQITPIVGRHPDLVLKTSQNLSRKAKLNLTIAKSAIGIAKAYPHQRVILIADEILLRDRISQLNCQNLCAIPSAIARQWAKTNKLPPIVQKLVTQEGNDPDNTELAYELNANLNAKSSSPSNLVDRDSQTSSPSSNAKPKFNYRQIALSLMKFGITATFIVTVLLVGWRLVQPQQFQQFWKKTGLPPLPKTIIEPIQPNKT